MKIKIVRKGKQGALSRIHRGYEFVDDSACRDYDWLVVFDEMPDEDRGTFRGGCERLACPVERTVLCTWEPTSVKNYSSVYTRQFGHYLSNRPPAAEHHPHHRWGRGYYLWFLGRSYDEAKNTVIPPKTKTISSVCSSKKMRRTKHYARFRLTEELMKSVPGMEWYGHGVRGFGRKYEVMDPYRYHVAVENHIAPGHWSEKIADPILSECLTFYAGDPDLGKVLPPESFIPIPIDDPAEAARIINAAIASDEYSRRRESVLEAKRLILEKYNFWDQVIELIESCADQRVSPIDPADSVRIYARKALRTRSPIAALEEAFGHVRLWLGVYR